MITMTSVSAQEAAKKPKAPIPPPKVEKVKFAPPKIVKDEEVKAPTPPPKVKKPAKPKTKISPPPPPPAPKKG